MSVWVEIIVQIVTGIIVLRINVFLYLCPSIITRLAEFNGIGNGVITAKYNPRNPKTSIVIIGQNRPEIITKNIIKRII